MGSTYVVAHTHTHTVLCVLCKGLDRDSKGHAGEYPDVKYCRTSTAEAATTGAAIDVPDMICSA